jgi:hypothetical protein
MLMILMIMLNKFYDAFLFQFFHCNLPSLKLNVYVSAVVNTQRPLKTTRLAEMNCEREEIATAAKVTKVFIKWGVSSLRTLPAA